MANTYTLIASVTVGSGGATDLDFTSIPSTYTDLVIKTSVRGATGASNDGFKIRFNNDSSTTYASIYAAGDGTNIPSGSNAYGSTGSTYLTSMATGTYTANTFSSVDVYIPNYTASTNKSFSADGASENNATSAWLSLVAGSYPITTAISRITLFSNSGSGFVQYSTAYLYGISNA
jgi:hypothetical protein